MPMERKTDTRGPKGATLTRDQRLKAALKANLKRRKAQAKARHSAEGSDAERDSDNKQD